MSDSNGGSFSFGLVRLAIFLVLLIISAPFLAIGYYKNSNIKSSMDNGLKLMQSSKYVEAQGKFEDAADSMGVLYDCYVTVLPIVGGTYYDKKYIFGLRGVARALAIGEKMGGGNFKVVEDIEEAERDISTRGKFPADAAILQELGEVSLRSYRVLLLVHADCEKGDHQKALNELKSMIENNKYVGYDIVAMPVCYLLHQIAINLKTADSIDTAKNFIKAMKGIHDHPLFAQFALAIDPLVAPSSQPRVASTAPQSLKEKYLSGLSHAKRKDFTKAMPILEDCHASEPRNNTIAYTLALVKRQMGQNDEARKLCEEILARNPGDEKAGKLLAALNK